MMKKAIEQLLPDSPSDKEKLRELYEFSDVISVDGSDLGQTTLVQHEINTQVMPHRYTNQEAAISSTV